MYVSHVRTCLPVRPGVVTGRLVKDQTLSAGPDGASMAEGGLQLAACKRARRQRGRAAMIQFKREAWRASCRIINAGWPHQSIRNAAGLT